MRGNNLNDFLAIMAVAQDGSFTKAAAKLGVSQSALSYKVRMLEARLGVRLLTRTTRSVSLTDTGERLLNNIRPHFEEIQNEIFALNNTRDKPAGTVRMSSVEHATEAIIWPAVRKILLRYPDIKFEIINEYRLVDIVAERYDAGVRLGEQVDKDMIALRIGPDFRMVVAGSPTYFETRSKPRIPQDLMEHNCIGLRLPTTGGLYGWEFKKGRQELKFRPQGRTVFNSVRVMLEAALDGLGLIFGPEDLIAAAVKDGRLVTVLDTWCPIRPGYHLYYPSRRQQSPAFAIVLEALRNKQ